MDGGEGHSLLSALRDASNALSRISAHYNAAAELSERLESNYIELNDCYDDIAQRAERIQFSQ